MVHPVKTPIDVLRTVTRLSFGAARHPLRTVGEVATQGRGLVAGFVTGHRSAPDSPKRQGDPLAEAAGAAAPSTGTTGSSGSSGSSGQSASATATPTTAAGESGAEAEVPETPQEQVVTEPSSVTGPGDDDEIPSPAVQPADEDVEVTTPVGTTGAGPGFNPDTTETDLQQPGTEPLMDPSTTKRIKRESETLRKAADPHKG